MDILQLWILFVFCLQNSFSRYNLTLPPEDTVKRMLLGQPYSLECYRSHEDKLAVLDTALATLDGSAILATIFHLKNTVKKSLFVKVQLHVLCVSVIIKCCLFFLMMCLYTLNAFIVVKVVHMMINVISRYISGWQANW